MDEKKYEEYKNKMLEERTPEFKEKFEQFLKGEKNKPLDTTGFHLIDLRDKPFKEEF